MRPYGLPRRLYNDVDVAGCVDNGRATAIYSINGRAFRSLRNGKKSASRRHLKRIARAEAASTIRNELASID